MSVCIECVAMTSLATAPVVGADHERNLSDLDRLLGLGAKTQGELPNKDTGEASADMRMLDGMLDGSYSRTRLVA